MSKISIIGSSSFLAKALSRYTPNETTVAFGRHESSIYDFPDVSFQSCFDLNQISKSDVIYYCAGQGIQPKNSDSDSLIYELNTFEPIRLINSLLALGYQGKIVTFGSYFEYGNSKLEVPFDEGGLVRNINPKPNTYCISKSLLTSYVHSQIMTGNKQLLHFILPNVYGSGENEHRLFPYIVDSMLNSRSMTFGAGTQTRQFVHVNDIAEMVVRKNTLLNSGIFHLGCRAEKVEKVIRKAIGALSHKGSVPYENFEFTDMNRRDTSMQYLAMNDAKARTVLGWDPKRQIETEILNYK